MAVGKKKPKFTPPEVALRSIGWKRSARLLGHWTHPRLSYPWPLWAACQLERERHAGKEDVLALLGPKKSG